MDVKTSTFATTKSTLAICGTSGCSSGVHSGCEFSAAWNLRVADVKQTPASSH